MKKSIVTCPKCGKGDKFVVYEDGELLCKNCNKILRNPFISLYYELGVQEGRKQRQQEIKQALGVK